MNRVIVFLLSLAAGVHPAFADVNLAAVGQTDRWVGLYGAQQLYADDDIDQQNPLLYSQGSFALNSHFGQIFAAFDRQPGHSSVATAWSRGGFKLGFSGGAAAATQAALPGFRDSASGKLQSAASGWRQLATSWHSDAGIEFSGGISRLHLADRVGAAVYQAGFATPGWSGKLAHIQRNGDLLARNMRVARETPHSSLSYAEFGDTSGHVQRAVQWATGVGKQSAAAVSLQAGVSPLTGLNEQRVLLQWVVAPQSQRSFDPVLPFQNRALNFMKNMIIAGGIIAGAVAVASASGKADGEEGGFSSSRDAARAALNKVNPRSIRENREYGGWVYRAKGDSYSFTSARSGALDHVSLGPKPQATQASYHTHGGNNPGFDGEHFSASDIRSDNQQGVDGYLGTPLGRFLYYNRSSGSISQIGSVATR